MSKIGKTVMAGTISHALCMQRVRHLFIALEMDNEELEQRRMARAAELKPSEFLKDTGPAGAAWSPAIEFAEEYGRYCLYRRSAGGITFPQLAHVLTAAVYRHKIKGVILDYWQLVDGQGAQQSKSDHLEKVAQWMAKFCRRHRLFSVVNVQLKDDGSTFASRGIRRAVDQRYTICREGELGNWGPRAWLECMESRYTFATNVGNKDNPALVLEEKGPYFRQIGRDERDLRRTLAPPAQPTGLNGSRQAHAGSPI